MDNVLKMTGWTTKKVKDAYRNKKVDWTVNTLDYAVGDEPVVASDYDYE